jgi:glycosyltransferase involved in cell wall biosynthesis
MRKTILIVTDNLPEQINGVVTTFRNLERVAGSDGYDVVYLDPGQFPHCDCPGYPEVKVSWPRGIGRRILEIAPDHVHIATEGTLGLAARLWLDHRGWRYNTSYHTRFPEFVHKMYGIPVSWTYRYLRWFHKHSGRVLTTTDTMVRELQDRGFRGDIRAWTRGVDRDHLRPSQPWKHERRFNQRPRVLNVGRISVEKNLDELCRLQDEFDITIVGDGPDRARLEQTYRRVRFPGYRSGSALADCYAQADVFAFPSLTDTFGIVMIESLSVGTPVAGHPCPGPLDIVEPGVNGYLGEDLAEAIRRCLSLDRSVVQASSEKWTWHHCWSIFRDNLVDII